MSPAQKIAPINLILSVVAPIYNECRNAKCMMYTKNSHKLHLPCVSCKPYQEMHNISGLSTHVSVTREVI